MAKADTWMPFYVADYLKDTMHLTRDQHGGYMLLLMACWNGGGRLPNDNAQLAALAKATPAEWRKMAPILRRFFTVEGDELVHGRVVQEHEKAQRLSDIRRENGGKGGRPKKQTETGEKATGLAKPKLTETPSPSPVGKEADASTPTQEATASSVGSAKPTPTYDPWTKDPSFTKAWDACTETGRKRSSRKKAWPEWRAALKRESGEALAAAMARYVAGDEDAKRTGGPGFHVWLKDARYEHWTAASSAGAPAPASFDAPAVRASIVKATDEDFARRYVDHYCRWVAAGRRLEAKTPAVVAALTQKLAAWAKAKEVTIALMSANDTPPLFAEEDAA